MIAVKFLECNDEKSAQHIASRRLLKQMLYEYINIKNKLYWLIVKSGIADKSYLWWITPNVVIFISIIVFIVSFTIFIIIFFL